MKYHNLFTIFALILFFACSTHDTESIVEKTSPMKTVMPVNVIKKEKPNLLKNKKLIKGNTAYHIATVNGFPDKASMDLTGFGTFYIRGWAIDKPANTLAGGVIIQIDDKTYQARYGKPKPGVATKFNNPALVNSEFECRIPMSEIGKGKHTYSIKILTKDKRSYYSSGKREITVQ